jgi:hypothetical protein
MEPLRELLQETHDSTVRQEVMIKAIIVRMDQGDLVLKNHEDRIVSVESSTKTFTDAAMRRSKAWNKVWMVIFSAGAIPVTAALWDWLVTHFHH